MAALAETNISVTLVKNTIGSSLNGVGGLRSAPENNWWGFNSFARGWGNTSPTSPFKLGDYRGYDHLWRCYSADEYIVGSGLGSYETDDVQFLLYHFPSWSSATTGVNHYFDAWFNRTNDFTHGTETKILTNQLIQDGGSFNITIDPLSPPDGGGALTENTNVYIKVKWITSPTRRWDSNQSLLIEEAVDDTDAWILTVPIGEDLFTYTTTFTKYQESVAYKNDPNGFVVAYPRISNGNRNSVSVNMSFQMNNLSDFTGIKNIIVTDDFVVPAGSVSGGVLVPGILNASLSSPNTLSQWANNETFYGRVRINTVSTGTASTAWATNYGGTVTTTPPV